MDEYIRTFNRLAISQENIENLEDVKLWLTINDKLSIDIDPVVFTIRKFLKNYYTSPVELVGNCFSLATGVSQLLIAEQIRHTITIGNVFVNSKPQYNVSKQSIETDMEIGFIENEPAHAHTWLTMENGTIIDLTIFPSLAYKLKKKALKWNNAIYTSNKESTYNLRYIPLFLGPEYIIKAATIPCPEAVQMATNWIFNIDNMMNA